MYGRIRPHRAQSTLAEPSADDADHERNDSTGQQVPNREVAGDDQLDDNGNRRG
jgi:hypothetical protein